ncbi:MAG: hypothetical protein ACOCWQ_00465 [Nanoarchaeota archaeon]
MHDYEILKYTGIGIFAIGLSIIFDNILIIGAAIAVLVFAASKASFHHHLESHTRDYPRRIRRNPEQPR